ncbi:uncharacterized protein PAC_11508 [Phialocephala subalpina]|uniref:Uncharacterized protein n=1 Tax=Phialocephala subalpina TaxID=576137 RepID=A0A1L7X9B3_9HELO|nr:uncharacterized protein PAC_11508 [Phialocephala subalpina]
MSRAGDGLRIPERRDDDSAKAGTSSKNTEESKTTANEGANDNMNTTSSRRINRLSREECLRHYKTLFVDKYYHKPTYFNAEIDTLQFGKATEYQFARLLEHLPNKDQLKKLPSILHFTHLETVLISNQIYPDLVQTAHSRGYLGHHEGLCQRIQGEGCRHCFPAFDKPKISEFLKDVRGGKWNTNVIDNDDIGKDENKEDTIEDTNDWREPVFEFKYMCIGRWKNKNEFCPWTDPDGDLKYTEEDYDDED